MTTADSANYSMDGVITSIRRFSEKDPMEEFNGLKKLVAGHTFYKGIQIVTRGKIGTRTFYVLYLTQFNPPTKWGIRTVYNCKLKDFMGVAIGDIDLQANYKNGYKRGSPMSLEIQINGSEFDSTDHLPECNLESYGFFSLSARAFFKAACFYPLGKDFDFSISNAPTPPLVVRAQEY